MNDYSKLQEVTNEEVIAIQYETIKILLEFLINPKKKSVVGPNGHTISREEMVSDVKHMIERMEIAITENKKESIN